MERLAPSYRAQVEIPPPKTTAGCGTTGEVGEGMGCRVVKTRGHLLRRRFVLGAEAEATLYELFEPFHFNTCSTFLGPAPTEIAAPPSVPWEKAANGVWDPRDSILYHSVRAREMVYRSPMATAMEDRMKKFRHPTCMYVFHARQVGRGSRYEQREGERESEREKARTESCTEASIAYSVSKTLTGNRTHQDHFVQAEMKAWGQSVCSMSVQLSATVDHTDGAALKYVATHMCTGFRRNELMYRVKWRGIHHRFEVAPQPEVRWCDVSGASLPPAETTSPHEHLKELPPSIPVTRPAGTVETNADLRTGWLQCHVHEVAYPSLPIVTAISRLTMDLCILLQEMSNQNKADCVLLMSCAIFLDPGMSGLQTYQYQRCDLGIQLVSWRTVRRQWQCLITFSEEGSNKTRGTDTGNRELACVTLPENSCLLTNAPENTYKIMENLQLGWRRAGIRTEGFPELEHEDSPLRHLARYESNVHNEKTHISFPPTRVVAVGEGRGWTTQGEDRKRGSGGGLKGVFSFYSLLCLRGWSRADPRETVAHIRPPAFGGPGGKLAGDDARMTSADFKQDAPPPSPKGPNFRPVRPAQLSEKSKYSQNPNRRLQSMESTVTEKSKHVGTDWRSQSNGRKETYDYYRSPLRSPPTCSFFPRLRAEKLGSDKDDTAMHIKCAIATKRKALVWRAGWEKRENPKKSRRPKASSGTIPPCENPVTQLGIEPGSPWWEASGLMAQPPWPSFSCISDTLQCTASAPRLVWGRSNDHDDVSAETRGLVVDGGGGGTSLVTPPGAFKQVTVCIGWLGRLDRRHPQRSARFPGGSVVDEIRCDRQVAAQHRVAAPREYSWPHNHPSPVRSIESDPQQSVDPSRDRRTDGRLTDETDGFEASLSVKHVGETRGNNEVTGRSKLYCDKVRRRSRPSSAISCLLTDLKQDFQKCSFNRGQLITALLSFSFRRFGIHCSLRHHKEPPETSNNIMKCSRDFSVNDIRNKHRASFCFLTDMIERLL
ncbi:hypothetical protein PR048_016930 [Dryococelus australis]|uniref:WW domain-containing protein n=1 Tax=Dryococelus australis TaxID=614101 RepID=A0ABQ9H845_9NEOP|nr:hypothetical protein PR048_016930 [Dryococelus australis]